VFRSRRDGQHDARRGPRRAALQASTEAVAERVAEGQAECGYLGHQLQEVRARQHREHRVGGRDRAGGSRLSRDERHLAEPLARAEFGDHFLAAGGRDRDPHRTADDEKEILARFAGPTEHLASAGGPPAGPRGD